MAKLKVPSLQHLARNWRSDPQRIKRELVSVARNPPNFSYSALFSAARDMLMFGYTPEQIIEGLRRGIARRDVRDNLISVIPLFHDHFSTVRPTAVQAVGRRYYGVGRNLKVPFDPPLIYRADGRWHFPWFSFWRSTPLTGERLSLFVSIVRDVLLQDPDLEEAKFVILDFSASAPKEPRDLTVIDAQDVPPLSESRKSEMLSVFAEGYVLAQAELAAETEVKPAQQERPDDSDHPDLFKDSP